MKNTLSTLLFLSMAVAAALLASQSASACMDLIEEPQPLLSQMLIPAVADRLDLWSERYELTAGGFLYIFLPDSAKVDVDGDKDQPALERLDEGDKRLPGDVPASLLRQSGYHWRLLLAARAGNARIDIDSSGQKKTLTVNVKAFERKWIQVFPKPYTLTEAGATREKPAYLSAGSEVEITLPGTLQSGWSVNDVEEGALELQKIEQSNWQQPQVKLSFHVSSHDRREPYHLVIRRGSGLFGESHHFYLLITPAPLC